MQEHETISSFLDRVGASYGMSRLDLFKRLDSSWDWDRRAADVDRNFPKNLNTALGSALGMEQPAVPFDFQSVPGDYLAASWRTEYCPSCFYEDLLASRPPHFRWQWASEIATCCHIHGTPLLRWRRTRKCGERVLPVSWAASPSPEAIEECTWLASDLELVRQATEGSRADAAMTRLVMAFERGFLKFRVDEASGRRECVVAWPELVERIRALGASMEEGAALPLAARVLPAESGLFGLPQRMPKHGRSRGRIQVITDPSSVAWRRTLNWFVARTLLGQGGSRLARDLDGEAWLETVGQATAHPELRDRLNRASRLLTTAAKQPAGGRLREREPDQLSRAQFQAAWGDAGSATEPNGGVHDHA
ncbi:TniQ family protein [Arenimonas sp. SCN 70-307]|uniref:TniQ family protein n=1 Tax=Arenimonas sp. SCN 70-307 TaxID=1660089 RepID=UPI0025C088BC|nr:TniQ family protein [Arenimonas sp. SCN 70-307]